MAHTIKDDTKNNFVKGYVCACSALLQMIGEHTYVTELYGCCYHTVHQLRKMGVEESDIKILMPVIQEIKRKKRRNKKNDLIIIKK